MIYSKSIVLLSLSLLLIIIIADAAIISEQQDVIVNLHNKLRKMHDNTPALKWNTLLARESKRFVDACQYYDKSDDMNILKKMIAVDNVARGYDDWNQTINAWYSGYEYYDYDNPGYTDNTGTFITMIWKDSKEIGCSSLDCPNLDGTLYQCLYSPSIPIPLLFNAKEYELNVLPRN